MGIVPERWYSCGQLWVHKMEMHSVFKHWVNSHGFFSSIIEELNLYLDTIKKPSIFIWIKLLPSAAVSHTQLKLIAIHLYFFIWPVLGCNAEYQGILQPPTNKLLWFDKHCMATFMIAWGWRCMTKYDLKVELGGDDTHNYTVYEHYHEHTHPHNKTGARLSLLPCRFY